MKRFTCALTLLALAVLVPPSAVQAAEVSFFRGKTASVEFYSTDPAGCLVTSVTAFANESGSFSPPAPQEADAWADVSVYVFDRCTGEQKVCGMATFDLPDGAFNVAGLLASATLTVAGGFHDFCAGAERSINVVLTWNGEGDLSSFRANSSLSSPGYHVSYRQKGQEREATVTGSVTVDGIPLSLDNGNAYLAKTSNGTVTRFQ
jgi:hypothetical protein